MVYKYGTVENVLNHLLTDILDASIHGARDQESADARDAAYFADHLEDAKDAKYKAPKKPVNRLNTKMVNWVIDNDDLLNPLFA